MNGNSKNSLKIAILDDYARIALSSADWARLGSGINITAFDRPLGVPEEAAEVLADFDIVCHMRERMAMPRALVEKLPRLKLVVFTGAQHTTLDLAALEEQGVTVCRTQSVASTSAAELAFAHILAGARHVVREDRNMRQGGWQSTVGTYLQGRTLGILGLGHMGTIVARYALAFEMDIIAWSQNLTPERAAAAGARLVSKEELLRQSDFLTIQTALSDRTRGLIGAGELALMKPSAYLVNTARAAIVDETALIDALRQGRLGGAGLDVFNVEPLPPDHPYRTMENVVLTPHLGYVTDTVFRQFYSGVVDTVAAWLHSAPTGVYRASDRL